MPAKPDLSPWVKADLESKSHLYWFGAPRFPLPPAELEWTREFVLRLEPLLTKEYDLESSFIIPYSYVKEDNAERFADLTTKAIPQMGLRHNAGEPIPKMTRALATEIANGRPYNPREFTDVYLMRLLVPNIELYMKEMWGQGEAMVIFLPAQPAAKVPKLPKVRMFRDHPFLSDFEPAKMFRAMDSAQHKSLQASKEVFAADLAGNSVIDNLSFALPRLDSQFYLTQDDEVVDPLMDLFPVQIFESRKDQGVLIASGEDLDEMLLELLEELPWFEPEKEEA